MVKLISWVLLCGLLVCTARAAAAQTARAPGHIVAVKVRGTVTALNLADQTQVQLTENAIITQQYVVTTGTDSSVILVMSNGSSLNLGADSRLSIDEFLQDPFADNISLADLQEEPTTSTTKITLSRGELVGNVKKIREDAGSTFTVNTPVGAAGIRGTTFRIVFRPDASGRTFFTLSTAEGRVIYEAPAGADQVPVVTGNEVVVTVDVNVDATTGAVTLTAPPSVATVQEIPPATQAAIAVAAQQIVEVAATAIIASTEQAAADKAAADKAAADKAAADKAAAEKAAAEKEAAEKEAAEKAAAEKEAQEKAAAEKAAQEKAAEEQAAQEKAAQEQAAQEKAAQEQAAQEQAAQEQAAQEQAAQEQAQQQTDPQPQQQETPAPPSTPTLPLPTTPPSNTTPGDGK